MVSSVTMTGASRANVQILKNANAQFQTAQKAVATGKWVFSAADDATRYTMSERMLGQCHAINRLNTALSTQLVTLETTGLAISHLIDLAQSAQTLARKAQAEDPPPLRVFAPTAVLSANSPVVGYPLGAKLSITSDSGANFTYTFTNTGTTWGDVAAALNSKSMGVRADFSPMPGIIGAIGIRFIATNGYDFRFDPISDQTIMDDLASPASANPATGKAMDSLAKTNALFGSGGVVVAGETGLTVGYGGAILGQANITTATPITGGSLLVFQDGSGDEKTLLYPLPTTLQQVIDDIKALGTDIRAELINVNATGTNTVLSLRNIRGEAVDILAARGSFEATGTLGLSPITGARAEPVKTYTPTTGNIVTNGSFEGGVLGPGNLAPGWNSINPSALGLHDDPARLSSGLAYVPFGGWTLARGADLWQNVPTVTGNAFTGYLDAGGALGGGAFDQSLTVRAIDTASGTVLMSRDFTIPMGSVTAANTYSFSFTATSASTRIEIIDTTPFNPIDTDLDVDNVRIFPSSANCPVGYDYARNLGLGTQYDAIRTEMDKVVAQNGYNGTAVNLLSGQNLGVMLNDNKQVHIHGQRISTGGMLGMRTSGATWFAPANIQSSIQESNQAITLLRDFEARIATWRDALSQEFERRKADAAVMYALADEIVGADMATESAKMSALQTRQKFAVESFAISAQNDQGLLRLLG